jgi:hypothetical protein
LTGFGVKGSTVAELSPVVVDDEVDRLKKLVEIGRAFFVVVMSEVEVEVVVVVEGGG